MENEWIMYEYGNIRQSQFCDTDIHKHTVGI